MDTMSVLGAMLDAGLTDAAAFAIYDPAAVQQMMAAGIGATVTLPLGGKLDMPRLTRSERSGRFAPAAGAQGAHRVFP